MIPLAAQVEHLDTMSETEWREVTYLTLRDFAISLDDYLDRATDVRWKRVTRHRENIAKAFRMTTNYEKDKTLPGHKYWMIDFERARAIVDSYFNLSDAGRSAAQKTK